MNTDPYLATKDIEVRKRLCAEHMRAHLTTNDMRRKTYCKISSLWCWRAVETFGTWGLAQKEVFPNINIRRRGQWSSGSIHRRTEDAFIATTDIEEKKKLIINDMITNLDSYDLRYLTYRKLSPVWCSRAITIFGTWKLAKKEALLRIKQQRNENISSIIQNESNTVKLFVKEYLRLKSIVDFGHFEIKQYDKYKSIEAPSTVAIYEEFKSFKNFYLQVSHMYPEIYFDPIKPYTEEDCEYVLNNIYKNYGFVSPCMLEPAKGYISEGVYIKKYGSLKNACSHFNIPYENKNKHSKLFLKVKKTIEKLLPSIEIVEEKKYPWLVYKDKLSIDMLLPFFNLAIEVDGRQHYDEKSLYNQSSHDTFEDKQMRDKIKDIELPKHNIALIRIRDYEVEKIPSILKPYVELLKTIQEYCAY